MGGVVVLNVQEFKERFFAFAALPDAAIVTAFETACMCVDNTPASPIPLVGSDPTAEPRKTILYRAVAHFLELEKRGMATVGRVASAAQGSVNVSFDGLSGTYADSLWGQTNHGLLVAKMLLPYRMGPIYVDA